MPGVTNRFILECLACGETGELSIHSGGSVGWSFATEGFVCLAADRYQPHRSIVRCNNCRSERANITREEIE